jgi:hypothetical protein
MTHLRVWLRVTTLPGRQQAMPESRPADLRLAQLPELLPRSHVGVDVPWLVIAAPENPVIRIDVRCLDRVGRHKRQLLLGVNDLSVALAIADGSAAVHRIVERLFPYTRRAPIRQAEVFEDAMRRLDAWRVDPPAVRPPEVIVGGEFVVARGDFIQIGAWAFRISEVRDYAMCGANIPLPDGSVLQAALALVVVAVSARPAEDDFACLSKRIADYEAART